MVKDTTLYDRLEISHDSDENQIKKAYNKLSKQWHPDKHIGNAEKEKATLKFKEINVYNLDLYFSKNIIFVFFYIYKFN